MLHTKLVRKKSGKAVKSALRLSSPSSTTTCGKAVHFSNNLEQTRHFLQSDCTASISADSSPTDQAQQYTSTSTLPAQSKISPPQDTRWDATSNNLHRDSRDREFVQLDDFDLSSDRQSLIGAVTVANIAFEKRVSARFTTDDWQTVSEVTAEYVRPEGAYDRFGFAIVLPAQAEAHAMTVIVCLRYQVNGQEFWDNNSGKNYFIIVTPERLLPSESRLSERYSFTASLHMTATSIPDEMARCVSRSEKLRVHWGALPTWISQGRSELDFGSTAYMDMIESLCYFKPSDQLSDVSQLTHRSSVDGSYKAVNCSRTYLDLSLQPSHAIHCF
jgi:hypothetical protein